MSPNKREQILCERFRFGVRKKREGALHLGGVAQSWTVEEFECARFGYESDLSVKSRVEIYGHGVWYG